MGQDGIKTLRLDKMYQTPQSDSLQCKYYSLQAILHAVNNKGEISICYIIIDQSGGGKKWITND